VRKAAGAAVIAAAALAQVTWAPRFEVGGAFPNLVLLVVVGVTWTLGARAGMVWACIGGGLLDLTSSGAIGPHALALLAGAHLIGLWTRDLERVTVVHVALTAVVATIVYSAVLVLIAGLLGQPAPDPGVAVQLTVAAAAYNALLMPFAIELLRMLQALTRAAPAPS
jgi:rod shape-determining protein MreD